jgi:hypothetical protein
MAGSECYKHGFQLRDEPTSYALQLSSSGKKS